MIDAPLALAFGAGLVATVNPCGFAMLPAYMSYFVGLGDEHEAGGAAAVRRALVVGGVMSAAFLAVFGLAGVAISAGFRAVIDWIPWVALTIGVGVGVLGAAMVLGYTLVVSVPRAKRAGDGRGLRTVFAFGASYAAASLSCTLPVFLTVVASQLTTANFVAGLATFVAYGLGMSLVLLVLTLALALGRRSVVHWMRGAVQYVNRVAGVILIAAGAYIVWFWSTNLSAGPEGLGDSGAFRFMEDLSRRAFAAVDGNVAPWGLALGGVVVGAVVYLLLRTGDEEAGPAPEPVAALRGDD